LKGKEMKTGVKQKLSLWCSLSLLLITAGCYIEIGSCAMTAKYERQVTLSEPMQAGEDFFAQTHNGSITVKGADVSDCNIIAAIIAHAVTDEKAKELAEKTQVRLERQGNKLVVKIDSPSPLFNASVSVSLDVTVPKSTNPELITHNGPIEIRNIIGKIDAITHNGQVVAEEVSGTTKMETHNGSITCNDLAGNANLKTHNGQVHVHYSPAAATLCEISLFTQNGGIEFVAPTNFSAAIQASTHNGSIKTNLPIKVIGELSKSKIQGTIGSGEGKLHLETYNGSITIR
jgi:tRNA threonylcarbamoyladenosine modification (KEOPS) complex  Pcc1 subunit